MENGTAFTHEFGDINESFYNCLESVLNEMAQLRLGEGSEIHPKIRERIQRLTIHANNIGWGYGAALCDQVCCLENEPGGE